MNKTRILFASESKLFPNLIQQYHETDHNVKHVNSFTETMSFLMSGSYDCAIIELDPDVFTLERADYLLALLPSQKLIFIYNQRTISSVEHHIRRGSRGAILIDELTSQYQNLIEVVILGGKFLSLGIRELLHSSTSYNPRSRELKQFDFWQVAKRHLTARQMDVLELLLEGLTNQQIAEHLNIAKGTVSQHIVAIFRGMNVSNRNSLISMASNT